MSSVATPWGRAYAGWRGLGLALANFGTSVFVLAACIVAFVPLWPGGVAFETLDGAWMLALTEAVARGFRFGPDVVFTYGPYSANATMLFHPGTDARTVWTGALTAMAVASGLLVLTTQRHRWAAVLIAAVLGLQVAIDSRLFAVPLMFLVVAAQAGAGPAASRPVPLAQVFTLTVLATVLGLVVLIKGSLALAASSAIGSGLVMLCFRGQIRFAAALGAVFVGSVPLFWILAHQNLADLPRFFTTEAEIVAGYTEAMAFRGKTDAQALVYLAASVATLLLVVLRDGTGRESGTDRFCRFVLGAEAAFLLLLGFKAGFVRADASHALQGIAVIAIAAGMLTIGRGRGPGRVALGLTVGLGAWTVGELSSASPLGVVYRGLGTWRHAAEGLAIRLANNAAFELSYLEQLDRARRAHPLPALAGRTDIYPVGQGILLANGLEWAPRPVFQSYSVYTPRLAQDNAEYLVARGPENVLFSIGPIDGRLPALEDGLSWPALLTLYRPIELRGSMAVLQRRAEANPALALAVTGERLAVGSYGLGEDVPLPSAQTALWARLDVQPTTFGRLVAAAFKLPSLWIVFRFADGREESYAYVSGMGRAGFLISPVVADAGQFLALESPGRPLDRDRAPVSFRIVGGTGTRLLWSSKIQVELQAFQVPAQQDARQILGN